ncbi:MAG: HRDC domain-containing protein [Planctomycetota bacterium]
MSRPGFIDTDAALERLVARLARQQAIAVDTESNPLYAYRERLCLVQISTKSREYLIDPLAGVDLALLSPVFADPGVVKVFHDAEFDVLMLKRNYPFEFNAIFDTKVAACALGRERVGLAAMLDEFFGVTLDKKLQRSDWGHRPLTEEQMEYASCDTKYLLNMAAELRTLLHAASELAVLEVAAECRRLCALQPEPKRFDPDEFVRIKGADALEPTRRRLLQELFVMRHEIADRRDCPAFKVMPNEVLLQIARASPTTRDGLERIRAMSSKLMGRYGDRILAVVARAKRLGPLEKKPRMAGDGTDVLGPRERQTYEALRAWRKRTAQKRPTDASLVLNRATMLELARLRKKPRDLQELTDTGVVESWWVRFYGDEVLPILRGGSGN